MILYASDPIWLTYAAADIGLREIPGPKEEPGIVRMLQACAAWLNTEAAPWCGAACAKWMRQASIAPPPKAYRAKSWLEWGKSISAPVRGCVVILGRDGGGHVGLAAGMTRSGKLCLIGGNQGDRVCVAAFDPERVLGYRLPPGDRQYEALPIMEIEDSRSEA